MATTDASIGFFEQPFHFQIRQNNLTDSLALNPNLRFNLYLKSNCHFPRRFHFKWGLSTARDGLCCVTLIPDPPTYDGSQNAKQFISEIKYNNV
jgi:hypothetical protein